MTTSPQQYTRAGGTIHAMQYTPNNAPHVAQWCTGLQIPSPHTEDGPNITRTLHIYTTQGVTIARYGDWVIQDPHGKFYACPQTLFEHTYQPQTT